MAQNVRKYLDPSRGYNRSLNERYSYIMKRLELYEAGIDDVQDLQWNIKDGMVGAINFTKDAMNLAMHNRDDIHPIKVRPIIEEIYNKGCFKILEDDGSIRCQGLLISSFLDQSFKRQINLEHVIPYSCYSRELIRLYEADELSIVRFAHIMSNVRICVVTREENSILDRTYKSDMPAGWRWDYSRLEPFARYTNNNIELWKA